MNASNTAAEAPADAPALRERISAIVASDALAWTIVAFGALLRIAQYAFNRSLWVDESFLALNIVERSFGGLTQPLFHNQAAPIGFLWLEKLAVLVFGSSELSLRLVPLLASLVSLVLFLFVARRVLAKAAAPVALALFAVSDQLIYYASEVKQYESDVAVALGLLLAALWAAELPELRPRAIAVLAIAGAAGVWLSHPAIFVLAGVGLTLGVAALIARNWGRVWRLGAVGAFWLANFALAYAVSLGGMAENAKRQRFWDTSFMPMPPGLGWFKTTFLTVLEDPVGLTPAKLALALFAAGSIWLVVFERERFFLLLSPMLLCLVASGLRKYPFGDRLVLFLVPVFVLVTVKTVEAAATRGGRFGRVLAVVMAVALLVQPSTTAARALASPRTHEELKPVLAYVRDHRQPDDAIYVYYGAQVPMRYYGPRFGLGPDQYTLGRNSRRDPGKYREQLDALRGRPRVWIILSHTTERRGVDEKRYFVEYLDGIGRRIDQIEAPGSSALLYDLRQ